MAKNQMMRHSQNIWLILLLCLFLNGCTKKLHPIDPFSTQASDSWQKYEIHTQDIKPAPFRISMSLQLGTAKKNHRANAILWGNSIENLRLDVMTGIGTSIAKFAQTEDDFLAYEPGTSRAYYHYGKNKPLLKLELPMPFGLSELAALLNGQYSKIFGTEYIVKNNFNGKTSFTLAKKDIGGTLQLNPDGLPIVWTSPKNTWTMSIQYSKVAAFSTKKVENNTSNTSNEQPLTLLPRKIEIIGPNSQKTVILIKNNQQLTEAFAVNNLKLILPDTVILKPLEDRI